MRNIFYLSIIILALIFNSCSKNNLNSGSSNLSPVEFSDKIKELPDAPVIDVRTPEEFSKGHLENAKNIVLTGNDFEKQISVFDKSKPVFIYCLSGNRSASAASIMRSEGFKEVYELSGGIMKWGRANLPVTRENIQTENISSGMTRKQFDDKLVTDKLVLFDFYADWCAPCREIKPYLDEISKEMSDKVEIVRINVDENQELCRELKIDGIPDLKLFKNKSVVWSRSGYIEKKEIEKNILAN